MAIYEHATQFAGRPVADWDPESGALDPKQFIYRVSLSYDAANAGEQWTDSFAALLDHPASHELTGVVVGAWGEMFEGSDEADQVVEALVAARDRLPHLGAIFFGDVISEECEISWLQQTDISPLFEAYPALEHFGVRGGSGLSLGALRHAGLRSLIIQSGGLGTDVVRAVAAAELPALEHLELWLGTPDYGGDATVEDLAPILAGGRFPRLTYLGLRDSEIADEVAAAVARAPVLEQVRVLDLSLGTLGDEGAAALLVSPAVARLEKLDIHHHYCSAPMVEQLKRLGIAVDAGDRQDEDHYGGQAYRYVAVGE